MAKTESMDEYKARQSTEVTVREARSIKVTDRQSYERLAGYVPLLKKAVNYFEELYRPRIRQADDVTKALRADMRKLQAPAEETIAYANKELKGFEDAEERRARAEAVRVAEEQRKKDEEKRLELAELAEQAGEKKLAEQILNAPPEEPIVHVQPNIPKVEGRHYREDWKFQIINPRELPESYKMPDEKKIGGVVRAMKAATNIPGVRVYMEKVPVVKS